MAYRHVKPSMARKPQVQARVEDSQKQAIDDYAERNDLSSSEALRQLIDKGAAAEGYRADGVLPDDGPSPFERLAGRRLVWLGIVQLLLGILLLASATVLGTVAVYVATGAISLGVISLYLNLVANLALIDNLSVAVLGANEADIDD